ncbi:uncharacterized protein METZ01_LOCUS157952, partial [marine metagenome]
MSKVNQNTTNPKVDTEEVSHPESLSVWGLAWPSILNNLLFASVGLVAIKAVGSLGAGPVAAVGTGQRIFWVFQALIMAVMAGTTALVARAIGSGNREEAAQVMRASVGICFIFSLLTTFFLWLYAEEVIGIFGLDQETKKLAVTYLLIIIFFTPVFSISMVVSTALRAAGDVKTPLYIGVFTNILNIYLLLGLVNGHYGMPNMGIVGAAMAGGISFSTGSVIYLSLWFRKKLVIPIGNKGSMSIERLKKLFEVG